MRTAAATPTNARWHFGNTRALYKLYFTSSMRDPKETADESACVRFARDFLPEVNKALGEVYGEPGSSTASAKPAAVTETGDKKAEAAMLAETVAAEKDSEKKAPDASPAEKELFGNEAAKPAAK